jgi:hypothetical protein
MRSAARRTANIAKAIHIFVNQDEHSYNKSLAFRAGQTHRDGRLPSFPPATFAASNTAVLQQKLMSISGIRSRLGVPQIAALLLLLVFLAQCLWFSAHVPLSATEGNYVEAGLLHLERLANAGTSARSPLVPLLAGVAARISGAESHYARLGNYRFWIRSPFLFAGLLLGASLWYVARRLYGNIGGYIGLSLYCFSPVMVGWASQASAEIVGAWGAFGLIFTSIAVAHTLYAPREVVLWNWRRILLMGLSMAICIGAQFSLWILLLPALGFMLWVGHVRRGAVLAIFAAACVTGLVLLWAVYSFRPLVFGRALAAADWLEISSQSFSWSAIAPLLATFFLQNGLGLVLLLLVTLVTFVVWKRPRFFGTAAPLFTGVLLVVLALRLHFAGFTFLFVAMPFLVLFMAGVATDLLQSRHAVLANAVIVGVLIANAMIDIYSLLHLTSRSR